MIDRRKLGMWLFVLSEAIFFLLLIGSYVYFRAGLNETPGTAVLMPSASRIGNPSSVLDAVRTGLFSLLLIASSGTMWFAERSARRRERRSLRLWLAATVLLGLLFLYGQATEYLGLIRRNITVSSNLFGSTFYTMTGFHGFHVFGGLVLLSVLLGLAWTVRPGEPRAVAVDTVAIYWHFVDAVWIAIFSVVYLWPLL
jgi:heme/copper-type cytochrome/quinol oxidase subunit 3